MLFRSDPATTAYSLFDLEVTAWITSRWPMSSDAKRAIPPPAESEQRSISVFPQFSTDRDSVPLVPISLKALRHSSVAARYFESWTKFGAPLLNLTRLRSCRIQCSLHLAFVQCLVRVIPIMTDGSFSELLGVCFSDTDGLST